MTTDRRAVAFTAMFRRHYPAIRRYLWRRAAEDSVDDLAAEVFTIAWRRFDDLPRDQLPWLYATAAKCLANQRRAARRGDALHQRLRSQPSPDVPDPHERTLATARREALLTAFAGLHPAEQELLMLTEWEQLSPRQAGRVLGIAPAAARARLYRVRRKLRAAFDEQLAAPTPCPPAVSTPAEGVAP